MQCDVPLLLSRSVLGKLGMVYHVEQQKADLSRLGLEGHPLEISPTGHPALCVSSFGENTEAFTGVWSVSWTSDEEVQFPQDDSESHAAYKEQLAAPRSQFKPLFFPKKLSLEVQNMLQSNTFQGNTFLAWWQSANQSRDFWIETPETLIRVHVVPRTSPFDPSQWKTSLSDLRSKLLNTIGEVVRVEVVPCRGDGITKYVKEFNWKESHGHVCQDPFKQLWIGRSCFPKRPSSSNSPEIDVCFAVTMEDETCRAGLRVGELRGAGLPEMDGTGVEADADRTERGSLPQGHGEPDQGPTKMSLLELENTAKELDIALPPKPTSGLMQKLIRERAQPSGEQVVTFGMYKSWMCCEVPEQYLQWSIKEVKANPHSSPDLQRLATWAQADLARRKTIHQKQGYVDHNSDPEVKAVVRPPSVAKSWSVVSSQSGAASSAGKEKRMRQVEEDIKETQSMDAELNEEDQKELLELETKLAALKQKNRLPPGGGR